MIKLSNVMRICICWSRVLSKKSSLARRFFGGLSAMSAPVLFGLSGFILTPTVVSHSDITSILDGLADQQDTWNVQFTAAQADKITKSKVVFADPISTGSISQGAQIGKGSIDVATLDTKIDGASITPDEERVTRTRKMGRVISVAPSQPPKNFSAGSIIGKQSALEIPKTGENIAMVFEKSKIQGKEIQVASAFYKNEKPVISKQVPSMLASLVTNNNADVLATAYAPPPPDYAKQSPFASILNEETKRGRFRPPIEKGDHEWAAAPLPPAVFSANEQRCLAAGIYFEARGEKLSGQAAVAQVILNRVRNPTYPNTICNVVYQNKHWRNRCQFSFACDGIKDRVKSPKHWDMAEEIALATTAGKIWFKQVGSSTHYHATYVRPKWAKSMRRVGRIGLHIFYVTYGGGWS